MRRWTELWGQVLVIEMEHRLCIMMQTRRVNKHRFLPITSELVQCYVIELLDDTAFGKVDPRSSGTTP